jgi:hypothetical protein
MLPHLTEMPWHKVRNSPSHASAPEETGRSGIKSYRTATIHIYIYIYIYIKVG